MVDHLKNPQVKLTFGPEPDDDLFEVESFEVGSLGADDLGTELFAVESFSVRSSPEPAPLKPKGKSPGALPVQIMNGDYEVVWDGVLDGSVSVELDPGLYVAQVVAGDGSELHHAFEFGESDLDIDFRALQNKKKSRPKAKGKTPREAPSKTPRMRSLPEDAASTTETDVFLGLWSLDRDTWVKERLSQSSPLKIPDSSYALRFLQVVFQNENDTRSVTICLPQNLHRLVLRPDHPEVPVKIESANQDAENLLALLHRGDARAAENLFKKHPGLGMDVESEEQDLAKALLASKFKDPIAAASGAFSLLKSSKRSELVGWYENLSNYSTYLADGAVACAWRILLDHGDLSEAREYLLEARRRGIPALTAASRRLMEGLMLFRRTESGETDPEIENELAKLLPYTDVALWHSPRSAFWGAPGRPGEPSIEIDESLVRVGPIHGAYTFLISS